MATMQAPIPVPAILAESVPVPDEGMVFSTVKIVRTQEAYTALEHPKDWSPEQIQAAAAKRRGDIAQTADWWDGETKTDVVELIPNEFDPDNKHRMPFSLGPDDLTAAPPITIAT